MKTFNLFGTIVGDESYKWAKEDVTPADFKAFLDSVPDGEEIKVQVNSPGGHVTAGLAIANMIKAKAASVTVSVLGIAASMASVIAAAAGKCEMAAGSFIMIHEPWGIALGSASELRKEADVLDSMKTAIIGFYASLFPGKSSDEIDALVKDETWIRGDQIEEYGLSATLSDSIPAFGSVSGPLKFAKIPKDAKKFYQFSKAMTKTPPSGESPAEEPPVEVPPVEEPPAPAPVSNLVALSQKLEEIEAKRRDLQSRCDKADAKIRELESTHSAALLERQNKISSLESEVQSAEQRISAMTLNALKGPSGGCAQSWQQALEECGGSYEKAINKYPGLAAAYRAGKQR